MKVHDSEFKTPADVDLYKSTFKALVDVLTCPRCKNVFTDPVILDCGHNICFNCVTTLQFKTREAQCDCRCPVCQAGLKQGRYVFNTRLGRAALLVNGIKTVIAEESSAAPSADNDSDSGLGSEDEQSEASFGSGNSLVNTDPPTNVASEQPPSSPFLRSALSIASMEPPLSMAPDKEFINKRTVSPYSVGSPWSVGSRCSIASMEPPLSMAPDKGFRKKHSFSPYSVGSPWSVGSCCSIASMEPPLSMAPDKEFINKRTVSPYSVGSPWSVGSRCSIASMEPPLSMAPDKGFTDKPIPSPWSVASPCSIASLEPHPGMHYGAELGPSSFLHVGDKHRGSERPQKQLCTTSNPSVIKRGQRFHPYPARQDRTKSSSLHALLELMQDCRVEEGFVEDVIVACQDALNGTTTINRAHHFHLYPARTNSSSLHTLWELLNQPGIDGGFISDLVLACQGVLSNSTSIQTREHTVTTDTARSCSLEHNNMQAEHDQLTLRA